LLISRYSNQKHPQSVDDPPALYVVRDLFQ